jgi:hypothetical protein
MDAECPSVRLIGLFYLEFLLEVPTLCRVGCSDSFSNDLGTWYLHSH